MFIDKSRLASRKAVVIYDITIDFHGDINITTSSHGKKRIAMIVVDYMSTFVNIRWLSLELSKRINTVNSLNVQHFYQTIYIYDTQTYFFSNFLFRSSSKKLHEFSKVVTVDRHTFSCGKVFSFKIHSAFITIVVLIYNSNLARQKRNMRVYLAFCLWCSSS